MLTVLSNAGCGSAIVEATFELCGIPYQVEMVDPWTEGPSRERLREKNPLLQVPTLLLDDGSVMTESAAMVLYALDLRPESGLFPKPGDADRPAALRWLIFLVAAIYPTFTYGDDPSRYVKGDEARAELRASTEAQKKDLWKQVDAASRSPWFFGDRMSVIDVYIGIMTRWRPGRAWFAESCPKLTSISKAIDAEPRLAAVKARNFPEKPAA